MLSLRNQTVNTRRVDLLQALKNGLDLHKAEYSEALIDYKLAVKVFMREAAERAEKGDFSNLVLTLQKPTNKESEYLDVIEMLEVSVDDNIQLDKESYKAFYKNEWSWSQGFAASASLYKTIIGNKY